MTDTIFAQALIKELEAETTATRKCIERYQMELADYKPHERSMAMGYLTLLCAEIPLWMVYIIEQPEIDVATLEHLHATTVYELVAHFDNNVKEAKRALQAVTDGALDAVFELKANGKVSQSGTKREHLSSTINHMVHHRGQLTVYLRMNNIPVPSLYGPSADEKS